MEERFYVAKTYEDVFPWIAKEFPCTSTGERDAFIYATVMSGTTQREYIVLKTVKPSSPIITGYDAHTGEPIYIK